MCLCQRLNSYQGARGFIFLWPHTFQFRDTVPIKGQEDLFSSSHIPSNSEVSRIRGDDPLDMVSLILKERHSKTKFRFLQTKMRPNYFLMLLTKCLKIFENIAFAFITSHNKFLTIGLSSFLAVYFSIMNLEQSVKDLQAQNTEFQALILNLSKGQDELKSLLTKKEKKTKKPKGVLNMGRRFKGPLKKVEEAEAPKEGKKTRGKKLRPILQLRDA